MPTTVWNFGGCLDGRIQPIAPGEMPKGAVRQKKG